MDASVLLETQSIVGDAAAAALIVNNLLQFATCYYNVTFSVVLYFIDMFYDFIYLP